MELDDEPNAGRLDENDAGGLAAGQAVLVPRSRGRPKLRDQIDIQHLKNLLTLRFPVTEIARTFNVCTKVIYRVMAEQGLSAPAKLFNNILNDDLDAAVRDIKRDFPNVGEVMMQGHLRNRQIHVQRDRIRKSLHRVDPDGVAQRKTKAITRRVYSVPCPNFLWHLDGNHKLIRWRLVVHGGIDGFTRIVTYLKCSDNNRSETVGDLFDNAVLQYGLPIRMRSDYGGENSVAWQRMYEGRGAENRPVIVGSSVHNERIERLNLELNKNLFKTKDKFIALERDGFLDPMNDTDLFCLHFVFIPRINQILEMYRNAHNNHAVSTEGNRTPVQLFYANQHLTAMYDNPVNRPADDPYHGITPDQLQQHQQPHVEVPVTRCPLSANDLERLINQIDPLEENVDDKDKYRNVVEFVGQCLLAPSE
ncbi:uncharacterized protein LOC135495746 [Lineus longissimus]|uniref:uncharacterized protein LOC135495746 n=1 Tax=Lineus longissimus TaxID=88925 RepID=UPI00315CA5C3